MRGLKRPIHQFGGLRVLGALQVIRQVMERWTGNVVSIKPESVRPIAHHPPHRLERQEQKVSLHLNDDVRVYDAIPVLRLCQGGAQGRCYVCINAGLVDNIHGRQMFHDTGFKALDIAGF
jgi:hypothetical protein